MCTCTGTGAKGGQDVWEGKEHPEAWLLPSLPGGLQVTGCSLGRDPWRLPHGGAGNAGEGSKAHRGPGEAARGSVVNGGIPSFIPLMLS